MLTGGAWTFHISQKPSDFWGPSTKTVSPSNLRLVIFLAGGFVWLNVWANSIWVEAAHLQSTCNLGDFRHREISSESIMGIYSCPKMELDLLPLSVSTEGESETWTAKRGGGFQVRRKPYSQTFYGGLMSTAWAAKALNYLLSHSMWQKTPTVTPREGDFTKILPLITILMTAQHPLKGSEKKNDYWAIYRPPQRF